MNQSNTFTQVTCFGSVPRVAADWRTCNAEQWTLLHRAICGCDNVWWSPHVWRPDNREQTARTSCCLRHQTPQQPTLVTHTVVRTTFALQLSIVPGTQSSAGQRVCLSIVLLRESMTLPSTNNTQQSVWRNGTKREIQFDGDYKRVFVPRCHAKSAESPEVCDPQQLQHWG